jgi:hypothetical protein
MLKPFFENGILREQADVITPGFIEALSIGFVRYMGDSRTDESGLERPLSVMFTVEKTENAEKIFEYFKNAFDFIGIDYQNLGNKPLETLKEKFFEKQYDSGIAIREKNSEIEIEIFERGDEIGGLEASLPGGVNFEGKVKSVNHALPIPQIAVNHIEHALNTKTGFDR